MIHIILLEDFMVNLLDFNVDGIHVFAKQNNASWTKASGEQSNTKDSRPKALLLVSQYYRSSCSSVRCLNHDSKQKGKDRGICYFSWTSPFLLVHREVFDVFQELLTTLHCSSMSLIIFAGLWQIPHKSPLSFIQSTVICRKRWPSLTLC